jgi:hypothetical protein
VGEVGEVGDPEFRVARLTVDLFRPPPMEAVHVTTRVARHGRRVRAIDVSMRCGEHEVARATALALRTGVHPAGQQWQANPWTVPRPDDLPPPDALEQRAGWDIRMITPGGFFTAERKRIWTRDTWQLVAGEAPSPLVRVALASDLANPVANAGTEGVRFINADITLSLSRAPVSEWVGLEASGQLGQGGIAIGSCTVYDTEGAIGWSSVCALATSPLAM